MRSNRTAVSIVIVVLVLMALRPVRTETQTPPPLVWAQLVASVTALDTQIAALQTQVADLQAALTAEIAARETADAALQQNINAAVPQNLLDLAGYVSVEPGTINELVGPHVILDGANVHIRNGLGATNGNPNVVHIVGSPLAQTNGLGNLVIGYNEKIAFVVNRSGSHNLVLGIDHQFSRFGGLLAGVSNKSFGQYASANGGLSNTASGHLASVTGGIGNIASGSAASVSGGQTNTASGGQASVSGGGQNIASGLRASVSGGQRNTVSGNATSVSGGTSVVNAVDFSWSAGLLTSP